MAKVSAKTAQANKSIRVFFPKQSSSCGLGGPGSSALAAWSIIIVVVVIHQRRGRGRTSALSLHTHLPAMLTQRYAHNHDYRRRTTRRLTANLPMPRGGETTSCVGA